MDATTWNRVKNIHADAMERDPSARAAFLDSACGDDVDLRRQVESLLTAGAEAGDFLIDPTHDDSSSAAGFSRYRPDDFNGLIEPPGTRMGRYTLQEPLGEGGFGTVYRAMQTEPVRRTVALKVIKPGMNSRHVVARFDAERQALAIMDHPHIARVFDAGATETGRPYFVMELVDGIPITRFCDENHLPLRDRLDLFIRVCRAVQHAHQKGIIHRDLKPSNVLVLSSNGRAVPKVIDFGVAKALHARLTDHTLTEARQLLGTPAYMSPEQVENTLDVDTRADVYSLGVLLYELLTGAPAFDSKKLLSAGYTEMLHIICQVEPPKPSARRPELRGDLDWIVMKALEKDRDRRYASANALADDVQRHLRCEPVVAGPPTTRYRLGKFIRRHRALIGASGVSLVALVFGLGIAVMALLQTRTERDAAKQARIDADRSREQTATINQFLEDMLTSADTAQTEGEELTVRQVLDEAALRLRTADGDHPEIESALQRTIGRTYSMIGEYDQATPHLQRALELHEQIDGVNSVEAIQARLHLADNLLLAGDRDRSEELVRESLDMLRAGEPLDQELLARHLHTLGRLSKIRNDFAAAADHLREAVELFRRIDVEKGPLARALGDLGVVLMRTADYTEAEAVMREAIDMANALYGQRSARAVGIQAYLAILYRRTGRAAEAETMYGQVLDVQRTLHGPRHPLTVSTMVNLSAVLLDRRAYAEAETLLNEACDALPELHGADSFQYAIALAMRGRAQLQQDRLDAAAHSAQAALDVFVKALGPDHEYVATALLDLGAIEFRRKNTEAAETAFLRAQSIYERIHGKDSPLVGRTLEKLGDVAFSRGDPVAGAGLYRQALDIYVANFGERNVELADCRSAWARQEAERGSTENAERLLREAIEIRTALPTRDPRAIREDQLTLGRLLAKQRKFQQAEAVLLTAAQHSDDATEASAIDLRPVIVEIVSLYEAWGRREQARTWSEQLQTSLP
jgi:eukaryotic-like serine/threonine-protein kinase